LSVEAFHINPIWVVETEVATNPLGAVGGMPSVTVTEAVSLVAGLAVRIAVMVTAAGVGMAPAGAVYRPEGLMAPCAESPPVTPFTCQVTAVFVACITVAVNCCVFPLATFATLGDTAILGEVGDCEPVERFREVPQPASTLNNISKPGSHILPQPDAAFCSVFMIKNLSSNRLAMREPVQQL